MVRVGQFGRRVTLDVGSTAPRPLTLRPQIAAHGTSCAHGSALARPSYRPRPPSDAPACTQPAAPRRRVIVARPTHNARPMPVASVVRPGDAFLHNLAIARFLLILHSALSKTQSTPDTSSVSRWLGDHRDGTPGRRRETDWCSDRAWCPFAGRTNPGPESAAARWFAALPIDPTWAISGNATSHHIPLLW